MAGGFTSVESLAWVTCLAAPIATSYFVGCWRDKHRFMPNSMGYELLVGWLMAAMVFILIAVIGGFANLE